MIIKKINKIAHSFNLLRVSFFKWCMKEDVVAAAFMFELTLFQIFGPRNEFQAKMNAFVLIKLQFSF